MVSINIFANFTDWLRQKLTSFPAGIIFNRINNMAEFLVIRYFSPGQYGE